MKGLVLFLATNLAIVLVLSAAMRWLGVEPYLNGQGLNLTSLLVFAAVMGFGGAFISRAISKCTAKKSVGAQVITEPRMPTEQWLVQPAARQERAAGIKMPAVAIWDSPEVNAFATGMSKKSSLTLMFWAAGASVRIGIIVFFAIFPRLPQAIGKETAPC